MTDLVADTSALVSLGVTADSDPDVLSVVLDRYDLVVPETVVDELRDVAAYEDAHASGAQAVLDRSAYRVASVSLDPEFPLDAGENAAVTLASERGAALMLCDEFSQIGLIHASLAETRLVTTPTLLAALVEDGRLTGDEAERALDRIASVRDWAANAYVQRARTLFE
ncbi:hypothetical protein [Halococcoides cellulosivorans]|uniref:PIN domain-containing protein n=1 Tax=Halococcoides cellulosivorans TaxID=1679096 RepID=A0A2R4WYS0_9EURY|nr:hypothetical protein [Halococcoides cellulosivorans]AWB26690.1 hypothetical protein HARCEL1_02655 [Halococcoides cellulosivorans]